MPVLNYHKDIKTMPDMSKLQKCDTCGVEQIGNRMYYANPTKRKIEVICRSCFLQARRPTPRALDLRKSEPSQTVATKQNILATLEAIKQSQSG